MEIIRHSDHTFEMDGKLYKDDGTKFHVYVMGKDGMWKFDKHESHVSVSQHQMAMERIEWLKKEGKHLL